MLDELCLSAITGACGLLAPITSLSTPALKTPDYITALHWQPYDRSQAADTHSAWQASDEVADSDDEKEDYSISEHSWFTEHYPDWAQNNNSLELFSRSNNKEHRSYLE